MSDKKVWVVLGVDGRAIEILKNEKHAAQLQDVRVGYLHRSVATEQIRRQIYAQQLRACAHCGSPVTWYTMELHERLWRGRGGEISVSNSVGLCNTCHQKDPIAGHGKRAVQWSHHGNA